MVPPAQGLQVVLIPHQSGIAPMWDDMINAFRHGGTPNGEAPQAKRMCLAKCTCPLVPRGVVPTVTCRTPILFVVVGIGFPEYRRSVWHGEKPARSSQGRRKDKRAGRSPL